MQSDEPVSLYLVIPPSDISRLRPLFRLIINQLCRRLTEELKPTLNKHRLLLLLDEFPALGRLDFFEHALGVIAGYGIKAMLVSQSLTQLDKTYGPRNSILDHTHVRVLFAPNTIETASVVSRMLGDKTETLTKTNYGGNRFAPWLGHVSVSDHEIARPLLTASEVMELSENDELVFVAGRPPIKAKKVRYYLDGNFTARVPERNVPQQLPVGNSMPQEAIDITDFDDDMQGVM
jgi:type IV secretion system protein VirD4